MMDDIQKQIKAGEGSGVQFKERILDKYDIACELVAFSNSRGGKLVVGIKDKTGETNALSYSEVQETTNLLSDMASENVVPSILIKIDTVEVEDGYLVIATVKEGLNKPYHDNKGIVWVKNGADKRKVFDNAELAEMMTDCGSFAPDEAGVRDATINDLDETTIKQFLGNRFDRVLEKKGLIGDTFNEASLDEDVNVTFTNNDKAQEFVITVWRGESNQVEVESNQVGNEVHGKSNEVCGKSNQVEVESNQVSNEVCGNSIQVEDYNTKKVTLTNKQKDIINFCSVPRTSLEIMERLGVSNQTKNRERYITSLVAAGYLQMTNPDNPTASNQKYKKVNIK